MNNIDNYSCIDSETITAYINSIQFYPVVKCWGRKIRPCLDNPFLKRVLVRDFNKYAVGRWGQRFRPGQYPRDFEGCDWDWGVRGRRPEYFNYVKQGACHWLVNFNLVLASLVEPDTDWRIISSDMHSTVWDGKYTLFDLNGLALFDDALECFMYAVLGPRAEVSARGEFLKTGLPPVNYAREVVGLRVKVHYDLPRRSFTEELLAPDRL